MRGRAAQLAEPTAEDHARPGQGGEGAGRARAAFAQQCGWWCSWCSWCPGLRQQLQLCVATVAQLTALLQHWQQQQRKRWRRACASAFAGWRCGLHALCYCDHSAVLSAGFWTFWCATVQLSARGHSAYWVAWATFARCQCSCCCLAAGATYLLQSKGSMHSCERIGHR